MVDKDEMTLRWQNQVVLYAVQAFLGLISRNVQAISLEISGDEIVVHFAVENHTPELDDDIKDMLFELDSLFEKESPLLTSQIFVGQPGSGWPGMSQRLIFWAKD